MQEKLGKIQEEAAAKTVKASVGGGMVTVTANGGMQLTKVEIDPQVLQSGDHEMLQESPGLRRQRSLTESQRING